jgi:hypothetical protein
MNFENATNPLLSFSQQKSLLEKVFWKISELYKLKQEIVARMLYISPKSRGPIKELHTTKSFPSKPAIAIECTSQLLGIHKNLSILFPDSDTNQDNAEIKYNWFNIPMNIYDGKSPIDFILDGEEDEIVTRLKTIRRNLDLQRVS